MAPRNAHAKPPAPSMSRDELRRAQALRRKKQKRRRKLITYGILLLFVVGLAVGLALTVFFHIESISVTGAALYSEEDIRSVAGIELQENLFLCDAKGAGERLTAQRPYIGQARIKRRLPGDIVIEITETSARFAMPYEGAYLLLDETGKVLEKGVEEPADGIALVNGGEVAQAEPGAVVVLSEDTVMPLFVKVFDALETAGISDITAYDVSNPLDVSVTYQDRLKLVIGVPSELSNKLRLCASAIEDQNSIDGNRRGTLDMSISKKVYFRAEKETQPAQTQPPETQAQSSGEHTE